MGPSRMELLHRHLTRFIAIDVVLLILLLTTMGNSGSASIFVFYMLLGLVVCVPRCHSRRVSVAIPYDHRVGKSPQT